LAEAPSLIPTAPAPAPAASATPAPAATPTELPKGTPEPSRTPPVKKFELTEDRIPEKYRTHEDPLGEILKGYDNLSSLVGKKDEEMRAQIEADLKAKQFEGRPETKDAYELPKIDGVDLEQMGKSPLVDWWRETAHAKGLDQKAFEEGINRYMGELKGQQPVFEDEIKKLGDNAQPRLQALGLWINGLEGEGKAAAMELTTTAKGVQQLEAIMRSAKGGTPASTQEPVQDQGDDQATIDKLMASKEYHSPAHRDPKVVERVQRFFNRKYAA
jgi:hypothetical protein